MATLPMNPPLLLGLRRFARAIRLDPSVFREIRDDPSALRGGALVVVLGGVAHGVGDWVSGGVAGLLTSVALALILWLSAGSAVAQLSRYFAPQAAPLVPTLRACAFAAAPVTLLVVGIANLPGWLNTVLWVSAHLAMTLAFVVAVREALRIDTTRALLLSLATLLLGLLLLFVLGILFIPPPAI